MANGTAAMAVAAANTSKAVIGGKIVAGTLDVLNRTAPGKGKGKGKYGSGDMAASYDFNRAVLSSVYGAKGAIASLTS